MKRLTAVVLALLLSGCGLPGGAPPSAALQRVVIISVDGLRPDLLQGAEAPRMQALLHSGTYTLRAETMAQPDTLPCHVSMLTGVSPAKHGVTWNRYIEQSYPEVPTLFELAKQAGLTTAMAAGKMKFIALAKPKTLDDVFIPPTEPVADSVVAGQAARMLVDRRPHVLFVHLAGVDAVGHDKGWGSPEQLLAIGDADRAVGTVLDALQKSDLTRSTLVILTADHGGVGQAHGGDDPQVRSVPWIASGPGVREGFDLAATPESAVHLADTFATACAWLGIKSGGVCEGKPVLEVLRGSPPPVGVSAGNGAAAGSKANGSGG